MTYDIASDSGSFALSGIGIRERNTMKWVKFTLGI